MNQQVRAWAIFGTSSLVADRAIPDWAQLVRGLSHPHAWIAQVGTDIAAARLAGAVLWCLALWLALAAGLFLASSVPGAVGRAATVSLGRVCPAVLIRIAAGAAGLSVVLAPLAASAVPPTGSAVGTAARPAPRADERSPGWPLTATTTPSSTPAGVNPGGAGSAGWPTSTNPATANRGPAGPAGPTRQATVRVEPGDSLWLIATRRVPGATDPQISTLWRQWYAANRPAIGSDPDLIHPGVTLLAPIEETP